MKPLSSTNPHVIVMIGIPGAGKTAFADHFAKTFHAPVVNAQKIQQIGATEPDKTAALTLLMLDELLKTKQTLVYEGPTATKANRLEIVNKISAAGYKPLLVWVQTESIEAKRRATRKQADGNTLSPDAFDAAIARFNPPSATEKAVVISGKHTAPSQLRIILKHLAGQQRPAPTQDPSARVRPTRGTIIVR